LVSGSSGFVPAAARRLKAGSNITITDGGPGGDLVISSTGAGGGGGTTQIAWMEIPSGSADGLNTDFTLSNVPNPLSSLMLYLNGVLLTQGLDSDYVMATTNVARLAFSCPSGSNLAATYPYTTVVTSSLSMAWMEIPSGSNDGVNTDFTLSQVPSPLSSLMFYVNGVLQKQGNDSDYVVIGGSTIRMNNAYRSGSNLAATYPY